MHKFTSLGECPLKLLNIQLLAH